MKTLVLGGTGKVGRRVAAKLRALGRQAAPVSRPDFDWDDEKTWRVVDGASNVFVSFAPDLAFPGADVKVARFAQVAVERGVRRIVLLSGRGEPGAAKAEAAVRSTGVGLVVVRSAFFAQNFTEGALGLVDDALHFPAGAVAEPFIDAEDVAAVAVEALEHEAHDGQVFEVTGPALLTFAEAVALMGRALNRRLEYHPVSTAEYRTLLEPHLPPQLVHFFGALFAEVLDGHNAFITDHVERVLGRPPRSFDAFVRDAVASGSLR